MAQTGQAELSAQFCDRIRRLPVGTSIIHYAGRRYLTRKSLHNDGKSLKLYAEELGGNDVISCNLYVLQGGHRLRACEMDAGRVIAFVENGGMPVDSVG